MAVKKKDFTKADNAVDKFFTHVSKDEEVTNHHNNDNQTNHTDDTYNNNNDNINNNTDQMHSLNNTNIDKDTYVYKQKQQAYISKATNKSKHYDERGKRAARFGLLLDNALKQDLKHLALANGNKSVNDFIVTILLDYVGRHENQAKLTQYKKILTDHS